MAKTMIKGRRGRRKALVSYGVELTRATDESESTMTFQVNSLQSTIVALSLIKQALNYPNDAQLELWTESGNEPIPMAADKMITEYVDKGDFLIVVPID